MTHPLEELAERVEQACVIGDKPSGRHMIEGQRMLAKSFKATGKRKFIDIAEVAETMACCIENEARLFDELRVVALEAAASLRARGAVGEG